MLQILRVSKTWIMCFWRHTSNYFSPSEKITPSGVPRLIQRYNHKLVLLFWKLNLSIRWQNKTDFLFLFYSITFSEHEQQSRKERLRQEDFYSIRMRSHKEIMVANRNLSLLRYNCFVLVLVVELAKNDFRKLNDQKILCQSSLL